MAATVVGGSGEDEGDLDETGGVGRVDGFGEADERVLRGDEGDLGLLRLGDVGRVDGCGGVDERVLRGDEGDLLCLLFFSGILAGDGDLLWRFLDVLLGLLLLVDVTSLLSWDLVLIGDLDLTGVLDFIGDLDFRSVFFHVSTRFSSFSISCSSFATESIKVARVIFLMRIFSSKVLSASSSRVGCMLILLLNKEQ